jgi:hypothetical protein
MLYLAAFGVGVLLAPSIIAQDANLEDRNSDPVVDALGEYGEWLAANSKWPIVYDHDRLIFLNGGGFTLSFHIETDDRAQENARPVIDGFTGLSLEEKRSQWLAEVCTPELDAIITKYQLANIGFLISPGRAGGPNISAYESRCVVN